MRAKLLSFSLLAMGFALALPASQAWACVGCDPGTAAAYASTVKQVKQDDVQETEDYNTEFTGMECATGGVTGKVFQGNERSPCPTRSAAAASATQNAQLENNKGVKPASFEAFKAEMSQPKYFVRADERTIMACAIKTLDSDSSNLKQEAVYTPPAAANTDILPVAFYSQFQEEMAGKSILLQPTALPAGLGEIPKVFEFMTGGQQGVLSSICGIVDGISGACQQAASKAGAITDTGMGNLGMTAANWPLNGAGSIANGKEKPNRAKNPDSVANPTVTNPCPPGESWLNGCKSI